MSESFEPVWSQVSTILDEVRVDLCELGKSLVVSRYDQPSGPSLMTSMIAVHRDRSGVEFAISVSVRRLTEVITVASDLVTDDGEVKAAATDIRVRLGDDLSKDQVHTLREFVFGAARSVVRELG